MNEPPSNEANAAAFVFKECDEGRKQEVAIEGARKKFGVTDAQLKPELAKIILSRIAIQRAELDRLEKTLLGKGDT